jgi:GNAT superfamily N-acetyltransferase
MPTRSSSAAPPPTGSSAPRYFCADYEERTSLRDGTPVLLRQVRPDDKELLLRGFEQLSERSRYLRFLVPKAALSEEELRYLTELDGESHFAIGAVRLDEHGQPGEGLGIARMIRYPGEPEVAEAAIAVADSVHGKGLGTLLFMRLVAAGGERGVCRFRCEVHASNSAMKDLIGGVNPEYSIEVSAGVMSIELTLPSTQPAESPATPPRESSLYRFFKLAARRPTEWAAEWAPEWMIGWATAALQLLRKPPPPAGTGAEALGPGLGSGPVAVSVSRTGSDADPDE